MFAFLSLFSLNKAWALATKEAESISSKLEQPDVIYTLSYEIDRSQVPPLYYNDLTIQITVGQVDSVEVTVNGVPTPFEYDTSLGIVQLTTSESAFDLALTNPDVPVGDIGAVTKSELKDDKAFAWSIGLDDNVNLRETVAALDPYGWQGTFFMIASDIDDTRDESWIIDVPFLHEKLSQGWSIGNHTWAHPCITTISNSQITTAYDRIRQIVDLSDRPDYLVTSFAAPCFVMEYHPVILQQRNAQLWPVQFNESGNLTPFIVDSGNTEDIYVDGDFSPAAYAFDYDLPVGRGQFLDTQEAFTLISKFDWMASRFAEDGKHIWHNSLVHGGKEVAVETAASYLYNTYGPNGTDQVWVAPSDQIYSYLLVRDNSVVKLLDSDLPPTATPTSTFTPTSTPTFTPTPTSTFTPTSTPSLTPTPTSTPTSTPTFTPTSMPSLTPTSTLAQPTGSKVHLPLLIE